MGYRDELRAAKSRIAQLESRLARLEGNDDADEGFDEPLDPDQPGYQLLRRYSNERKRRVAAQEKIESLAAQVQSLKGKGALGSLRAKVTELEAQLAQAGQRIEGMRAEQTRRGTSLFDHNRARRGAASAGRAGVLCPTCLQSGNRVSMRKAPRNTPLAMLNDDQLQVVVCPRCLFFGLMDPFETGER